MKLTQPRRLPYYLGARRQKLFLLSMFVLFFAAILLGNELQRSRHSSHSLFFWLDSAMLGLFVAVLVKTLFVRVVFSEDGIQYHFFWVVRRYRYSDLQTIRPISSNNLTARFAFRDAEGFTFPVTYLDADYLIGVLQERSPSVVPDLANLRYFLTPRPLRSRLES